VESVKVKKIFDIVFWTVIIVILLFVGYTYYNRNKQQNNLEQIEQKVLVPDFELKNLEGETVKLSDYRGKLVFLNFWAVWCPYCVKEMPDLDRTHQKFAKEGKAVVLAVDSGEDRQTVKEFIDKKNFTLPVLLDETGEVSAMYGIGGIPVTFIVNPDGTLYNVISGATNERTILNLAKKILKD
jgi:peroxiredoxin